MKSVDEQSSVPMDSADEKTDHSTLSGKGKNPTLTQLQCLTSSTEVDITHKSLGVSGNDLNVTTNGLEPL